MPQARRDIFGMRDAARDEDAIDFSTQDSAFGGDALGNLINHGVDE